MPHGSIYPASDSSPKKQRGNYILRILFLLTSLLSFTSYAETFFVNADNLNLRSAPSLSATILAKVSAGQKVAAHTQDTLIEADGNSWQKISFKNIHGQSIVGWASSAHLIKQANLRPYSPTEPKAVTFPLIDFETAYLLLPDGKFHIIEPEIVDGNFYGCNAHSTIIDKFCIQRGGKLFFAENFILARQSEQDYVALRLKNDGSICTFQQENLDPDMPSFTTCSSQREMSTYTRLTTKL